MKKLVLVALFTICFLQINAQIVRDDRPATRQDSLRGLLTSLRTCYDLKYYHLNVRYDPFKKTIKGSNLFQFVATEDFKKLQFDLFAHLKVEKVEYKGKPLQFTRELNAVFVVFPVTIKKNSTDSFTVYYSSTEEVDPSKPAPRRAGFVYSTDSNGKPWISTSCQGLGASSWWPVKEHQSDEVDSILISVSVPKGFTDVSNGRLRKVTELNDGYTRFDWFVDNPINNYTVSMNIGEYVEIKDDYQGEKGKLDISYWALKQNESKARAYFPNSVKLMLKAFEHWFGPYPFYEDSYKLVDAPYVGMEHQSAVTYGNGYEFGYRKKDISDTGWGMKWDFIIVHESAHEWFGNNITAKDVADHWIHESFTNYAEGLYVDYYYGKKASAEYAHGLRTAILNDRPLQGRYDVNKSGSKDVYHKGGVFFHMVRTIINDDEKWRQILRGLQKTFYHQTTGYDPIVDFIVKESGINFRPIFEQYFKNINLPILEIRHLEGKTYCRWIADVTDFEMPIRIKKEGGDYAFFKITRKWTPIELEGLNADNIKVDTFNFYVGVLQNETNRVQ